MGAFDSFYDEDSKCPMCGKTITDGWQTKRLHRFMGSWHKGDFVQYRKLESIPEEEREEVSRNSVRNVSDNKQVSQ